MSKHPSSEDNLKPASMENVALTDEKSYESDISAQHQDVLDQRNIIIKTLVSLVILFLIVALISTTFRDDIELLCKRFIDLFGTWGVFWGFLLPDAFTLPIPPDTFLIAGALGGLNFSTVVISASLGSILGGSLGYWLTRKLIRYPRIHRYLEVPLKRPRLFMKRYGLYALALGALTPLPYSMMCWACGALGVSYRPFLIVSLLRIPRVAVYLFLIQGAINVGTL